MAKVSGTKVEFNIKYFVSPNGNTGGNPTVTNIEIKNVRVKIGDMPGLAGHPDGTVAWDPTVRDAENPVPIYAFRFGSTYFIDGATIPIVLEAEFRFFENGGWSSWVSYSKTYELLCYNKAQIFGTTHLLNSSGDPQYVEEIEDNSIATLQAAMDALTKHTITPNNAIDGVAQTKTQILANDKVRNSTVLACCPHGSPTSFSDFNMANNISFEDEIEDLVTSKVNSPKIPQYNLVCFYACSVQGIVARQAYGIESVNQALVAPQVDLSFMAFAHPTGRDLPTIDQWVEDPNRKWTYNHAEHFWTKIAQGWNVNAAKNYAESQIQLVNSGSAGFVRQYMSMSGDYLARLNYVYLNATDIAIRVYLGLSLDIWWIAIPA